MRDAVIVDAIRTPLGRGKATGSLNPLHPTQLLAPVLQALVERTGVDPASIDDVICGCVSQTGEQAFNIGRNSVLAAGFPETVPAATIDRQCGSSQQAAHFAAQGVLSGAYDLVIAAGVESMSHVPLGTSNAGQDAFGPGVAARYAPGTVGQGISSELISAKWRLSREQLDEYSVVSHQRAAAATANGSFAREILPLRVPQADGTVATIRTDEGIRPASTVESLASLRVAFANDADQARFPEIEWKTTAGNSSQLTDGAAGVMITTSEIAKSLGLTPRARFHSFAVVGDDPILMLSAPIPATQKVLKNAGLTLDDIDLVEINEAFASVVLAWLADTKADISRVNVNGGAIALGHPVGASGSRLMTTLLHAMEERGARYGLQTMCEGGGMANATILERLG